MSDEYRPAAEAETSHPLVTAFQWLRTRSRGANALLPAMTAVVAVFIAFQVGNSAYHSCLRAKDDTGFTTSNGIDRVIDGYPPSRSSTAHACAEQNWLPDWALR